MKLQVYTVFDKSVGAYLQPFFSRAKGEALRSFTEACNDKASNFNKYSLDFTLVLLGEWDDVAGQFTTHDPIRVIGANEVVVDEVFAPTSGRNGGGMPTSALKNDPM